MNEKEYLTKEKHEELKKELEYLKKTKRKEVAEQLEYAKSLGDLSENAEYHEARDTQGLVEDRIKRIETVLKDAVVVSSHQTDVVAVGSSAVVKRDGSSDEQLYTIVGGEESDLLEGKISMHSPFGVAVMGKKKGDKFSFNTPNGPVAYTVIDIK
jgi:transcription elongation factor GreA